MHFKNHPYQWPLCPLYFGLEKIIVAELGEHQVLLEILHKIGVRFNIGSKKTPYL